MTKPEKALFAFIIIVFVLFLIVAWIRSGNNIKDIPTVPEQTQTSSVTDSKPKNIFVSCENSDGVEVPCKG